jgi:biotin--protein ligase
MVAISGSIMFERKLIIFIKRIKSLVGICVMLVTSLNAVALQDILIYSGPGAGKLSIENTLHTIKQLVGDRYNVITVGPEVITKQDWFKNTALLIMPGGADRPYLAKLRGQGNANIREYVSNGGKYLGICAGAYYSADRIAFAVGDSDLEVTGERELKFFPGLVSGPTYSGYDHRDTSNYAGTRAAKLTWQLDAPFANNSNLIVFYNGGGSFIDADKFSNVIILARYNPEQQDAVNSPAAIIECKVGKGIAVLSGPHFEWNPHTLDTKSEYLAKIKPQLEANEQARLQLAKHLLDRLAIEHG